MWAATNPSLLWNQIHSALWLQIMMGTRALVGDKSYSNQMVQRNSPSGGAVS